MGSPAVDVAWSVTPLPYVLFDSTGKLITCVVLVTVKTPLTRLKV
jgi:hypothetical protein